MITKHAFDRRFQLHEKLGEGGFGKVFRAHDQKLQKDVALKFVDTDGAFEESLVEYDLARRVNSPYSVRYFEAFIPNPPYKVDGRSHDLVLEMELITGMDLYKYTLTVLAAMSVAQRRPFFMCIAKQTLEGLRDIHRVVAHQDIKGENILIKLRGARGRPEDISIKYVDYGLSCRKRAGVMTSCNTADVSGTIIYLSPDRALVRLGELAGADPYKNDVYGLGRVLLEAALGRVVNLCGRTSSNAQCLEDVVQQVGVVSGLRELDFGTPAQTRAVQRLLYSMLAPTDEERPSAAEALRMFREIEPMRH